MLNAFTIFLHRLFLCLLTMTLLTGIADAQSFKLMRFDENYTSLKDSSRSFYNRLKYKPIDKKNKIYASFGGSARLEYIDFNNEDWGRSGIGHNNFLLQRYDVHADIHAGKRFRLFAQLRSAWETGRKNGPRPIDEDQLNIQNLFTDVNIYQRNNKSLTIRIGRQEMDYGSGRLISVREGPNLRLYFDGGKLMYSSTSFSIDAFAMMADTINTGAFDNKESGKLNLWGSYAKLIIQRSGNLDFYYLGINRSNAFFEEGIGKEIRHTIGTRFWKYGGGFIYNLEGAIQFGKFNKGKIKAWTASADIGYLLENVKGKPSINIRNDYISGDNKKGDGDLQTFNPIYPKGGYFGFSPQIGPVNLIDIHPYATINLNKKIIMQADAVFNWRYSLQDGVYRPSGSFTIAGASATKKYIGTAYLYSIVYSVSRFLSINSGVQYFKTGAFINELVAKPKDGIFFNTRISFKF